MRVLHKPRTQFGWMITLRLADVTCMAIFAGGMHIIMAAAGLTP